MSELKVESNTGLKWTINWKKLDLKVNYCCEETKILSELKRKRNEGKSELLLYRNILNKWADEKKKLNKKANYTL